MESYSQLQRLAEARDEDLIFAGSLDPDDVQRGLMTMNEVGQSYISLYSEYLRRLPAAAIEAARAGPSGAGRGHLLAR